MGRLNGNIDDDLHEWLRGYSQRKGVSMVAIVEGYLRRLRDEDGGSTGDGPRQFLVDIEHGLHVRHEDIGDKLAVRVASRGATTDG